MDNSDTPEEKNDGEPTYNPTQQYPTYYNNTSTPNTNQVQNPYSIPENPYGYQIDPVEQNPYGYAYNPAVPPGYYSYNNVINSNQPESFKSDSIENIIDETENVAEFTNSATSNQNRNQRESLSITPPPPPPPPPAPPQYIYDPDAPNCQVITTDNHSEVDVNDETLQNSFKQCGRCCIKCFCTTFIIILCIAIISSFMFR